MVTACAHVHNTLLGRPIALSEIGGTTAAREAFTVESSRGLLFGYARKRGVPRRGFETVRSAG